MSWRIIAAIRAAPVGKRTELRPAVLLPVKERIVVARQAIDTDSPLSHLDHGRYDLLLAPLGAW